MFTGALPTTSIYGTWSENIEIRSADDAALCDLSDVTEITLILQDPDTHVDELTLTMGNGDIVLPSTGIVQWRAEVETMGSLAPKVYKAILTLEDETDTIPLVLGTVAVVG